MKGRITDKKTGAALPFANVFYSGKNGVITQANWGTQSDANGNYVLEPGGGFYVTASFVGYKPLTITEAETWNPDVVANFALEPTNYDIVGAEIIANKIKPNALPYALIGIGAIALLALNFTYET